MPALKLSNQLLFSQAHLPLLSWDPSSPSSKTITSYKHCVTGWSFSISFPLLAWPLFPWYSAAREVNLLPILFLNLQGIRSWCQIFKVSSLLKLPDDTSGFIYLWMLWAFKPRRNRLSLPIKRFQHFSSCYRNSCHQFCPVKMVWAFSSYVTLFLKLGWNLSNDRSFYPYGCQLDFVGIVFKINASLQSVVEGEVLTFF